MGNGQEGLQQGGLETLREAAKASLGRMAIPLILCLLVAAVALGQEDSGSSNATWEPTWASIQAHQVPEWFHDAKLGIFPVWGIYSVPGWAPTTGELGKVDWETWFRDNPYAEWYWNSMKIKDSPTWEYHVANYGEDFEYEEFIGIFLEKAKAWDPDQWAELFQEAGGRYVVFTTKFHDGYPLWPSRIRNPNRDVSQLGRQRDFVGELTRAVKKRGMKMGFYYSGGLDWTFVTDAITGIGDVRGTVPQTETYARYVDAHWRELVNRYEPSVLWNDISYPEKGDFLGILLDFYPRFPEGVVNNRWGRDFSDFTTPEYSQYEEITAKKWEATRGLGFSFGYNRNEDEEVTLSPNQLIDTFVDIVSKNGNLLLAVGPKGDGSIPEIQAQRLRSLGKWLQTNGEGIYGSRPWVTAEGETAEGVPIRFTQKGESLYVYLLDKPEEGKLHLKGLYAQGPQTRISLLGGSKNLDWEQEGTNLVVTLPAQIAGDYAHALEVTPKPWKMMR